MTFLSDDAIVDYICRAKSGGLELETYTGNSLCSLPSTLIQLSSFDFEQTRTGFSRYITVKMPLQDLNFYGPDNLSANFDTENIGNMMGNSNDIYEGMDFASFQSPYPIEPLLNVPYFDASQPSVASSKLHVAGDASDVVESNIDPALRGSSTQPPTVEVLSTRVVAGDVANAMGSSINVRPRGFSTQPDRIHYPTGEQPLTMAQFYINPPSLPSDVYPPVSEAASGATNVLTSNINPPLRDYSAQFANILSAGYHAYGHNTQAAIPPAWDLGPVIPSSTIYPPPPPPGLVVQQREPRSRKRKQDSIDSSQPPNKRPYQPPSKRRPTMPDDFLPFIDIENPPRRESEVHDEKGSKDTTLASEYYYRINSLPPMKDFFKKGRDIHYQGPEFHRNVNFTGAEFMRYLCTSDRRPTLIIQLQPQKCNHRYIRGGQSFKCRNKDCPDPNKTIWKGHFRVCITEFYDSDGHWVNPFQSAAGYLHLYCLESMLNLSEVVHDVQVSVIAETRNFKHEPNNPMELSKLEQRTLQEWVEESVPKWVEYRDQQTRAGIPRQQWPALNVADDDRLWRHLTAAHLKKNRSTVKMAEKRRALAGGKKLAAHVDQMLGDVGKHVAVMKRRRDAYVGGVDGNEKSSTQGQPERSPEPPGKRQRLYSQSRYDLRSATPRRTGFETPSQPASSRILPAKQKEGGPTGLLIYPPLPPPLPQAHLASSSSVAPPEVPPFSEQDVADWMANYLAPPQFGNPQQLSNAYINVSDAALLQQMFPTSPLPNNNDAYPNVSDTASLERLFPTPPPEIPGSAVVEQSIMVNTDDPVSVPALTSPPRSRRSARHSPRKLSVIAPKSPAVAQRPSSPISARKTRSSSAASLSSIRRKSSAVSLHKTKSQALKSATSAKHRSPLSAWPLSSRRSSKRLSTASSDLDEFLAELNNEADKVLGEDLATITE